MLDAMGEAHAHIIRDRDLLVIRVYGQSAAEIPAIGDALPAGLAAVTRFVTTPTGAHDDAVQRFIASVQFCHLIVMHGPESVPGEWSAIDSDDIRHPDWDGPAPPVSPWCCPTW